MSRQPSPRMRKVNETLREVIAEEVARLTDPGIGFVTITGVDTSPDLRTAKVYYSAMGSEADREETANALGRAVPHVQATIAHEVRLKYTPKLTFVVDESIEAGIRISKLLREVKDQP